MAARRKTSGRSPAVTPLFCTFQGYFGRRAATVTGPGVRRLEDTADAHGREARRAVERAIEHQS